MEWAHSSMVEQPAKNERYENKMKDMKIR
jgi:hypothetical protein